MHVLHCITGLSGDGAQRMLLRLVAGLHERGHRSTIVTLGPREGLADMFVALGVPVYALQVNASLGGVARVIDFRRLIGQIKPTIAQGWMYHANVLLTLMERCSSYRFPVVWNIRRGLDDLAERKFSTRAFIKASALCSARARKIVYCTERSRSQHETAGFAASVGAVIDNGFNAEAFHRSQERRITWRKEFGIKDDEFVIGNVGRFDVAKGHVVLLEAFAALTRRYGRLRLVLVGRGVDGANETLRAVIERAGLTERVILYGECSRVHEAYSAFDLFCSSSLAEGFPNVVAEAMLCEVPCVVTDTGASRVLVDGVGRVVPPRSVEHLVAGLESMIAEHESARRELGERSRKRIVDRYSLPRIIELYDELYRGVLASRP